MAEKWIQKAIKHPGALREKMGVKEGKKIPAKMLTIKPSDSPTTKKQKTLAKTLKGFD